MRTNDMTILLGGDAGQGIQSTGMGLCQSLGRSGLSFFGREDYRSQIRGGHNFFQVRIKDEPLYTHSREVSLLIALTEESVERHLDEIHAGGGIIYDSRFEIQSEDLEAQGVTPFPVPVREIAREEGGAEVMANTASIGVAAGLTDFPLTYIQDIIEQNFKPKGKEIVNNNLRVLEAGQEYARTNLSEFDSKLNPPGTDTNPMVLDGNQAFALGAIASGCNFVSAYPMTPSTSIFEELIKHSEEYSIVTKQTESELAAINMAIGAGHVGARSLVTTSGGGFSLMVEALGLAGMTETPVVIAEVQRPGPSTGLPTRTEQADLLFTIHASQGEFPRLVLTPGTIEEYFQAGVDAFNLAENYQTPVIVLADQHLADSVRPVPPNSIDLEGATIDRGKLLAPEELENRSKGYLRHQFTESGISPRAIPGHPSAVYSTTSNEHDQSGLMTEDPTIREKMVDKRLRKLDYAREQASGPVSNGPVDAELTLIGWGSTFGAIREAVEALNAREDLKANQVHLPQIWPFPSEEVDNTLEKAEHIVAVENNATSQLSQLIAQHCDHSIRETVLKYDGRPFSPEYILSNLSVVGGGR